MEPMWAWETHRNRKMVTKLQIISFLKFFYARGERPHCSFHSTDGLLSKITICLSPQTPNFYGCKQLHRKLSFSSLKKFNTQQLVRKEDISEAILLSISEYHCCTNSVFCPPLLCIKPTSINPHTNLFRLGFCWQSEKELLQSFSSIARLLARSKAIPGQRYQENSP